MTPQQIQALIWKPGMSTAQQVTEVSGRGVGMDIVRTKIEGLHGAVDVESVPGQGTRFSIRLPLTLAILPCLMIVVDGETFAIPMELVKEIVALDGDSLLHTRAGRWCGSASACWPRCGLTRSLPGTAKVAGTGCPLAVCPVRPDMLTAFHLDDERRRGRV